MSNKEIRAFIVGNYFFLQLKITQKDTILPINGKR